VVFDFFDQLKSAQPRLREPGLRAERVPRGRTCAASTSSSTARSVDALSLIVHKAPQFKRGADLCAKLKDEIPPQQFEVAIQAAIGSKIIARDDGESVPQGRHWPSATAATSAASASCSRSRKKGKKRLKAVGNVEIPRARSMQS
jgi:GTP-binding protein LepA